MRPAVSPPSTLIATPLTQPAAAKQPSHGFRHVLGRAEPCHRDTALQHFAPARNGKRLLHMRVAIWPGQNRVEADSRTYSSASACVRPISAALDAV